MPERTPADVELPTVSVISTEQGCVLEMTGRMTHQLLEHARDLVNAQTRPTTRLTVRLVDTVLTPELIAMLIATRRQLARIDSSLHIEDPSGTLPLASDAAGHLTLARR